MIEAKRIQERCFEVMQIRVRDRTCRIRKAEITKAESEMIGNRMFFAINANDPNGVFHGFMCGWIGPRGGVRITAERYDF